MPQFDSITKKGRVGLYSRFDYCENLYQKDLTKTLRINVDKALINFQSGIDAAIVSTVNIPNVG